MKRTRLRKQSIVPIARLKRQLWQLCRGIIIGTYGNDCYTCPAKDLQGSNRQVGHFVPSSVCSAAMRYDLANLKIQCMACNIHRSGNWPAYEAHLIRDGQDVEELKQRNEATKGLKYDSIWYQAKIQEYEILLREVQKSSGAGLQL